MKLRISALLIFFSFSIYAQTREVINLWTNEVLEETNLKKNHVQYKDTSDNVIRLTNVTNPSLKVFKPQVPNQSKGAIIVCPGGGYNILAIDKEGYEIAEWLNGLGYTAFVLKYQIPQKQEEALQDIQRAIKIVRSKASLYNLNPEKIGVMGFSAGGHLAALASTNYKKNTYLNVDETDDFTSRPNFSMLIYPAYLDRGKDKSISSELEIDNKTPPFFVFGTADDTYGNSALVITTTLRDKKVPVELHLLSKGGHGYGLREGNVAAETWPNLAETWLNKMVKSRALEKYQRTINFPKVVEFPSKIPKKKDVWVFILAGQSNMVGRGFVEPKDTIANKRILTIDKKNNIILAKEPLHFYEPTMAGLDCGMSFAKKILHDIPENVSILLIPTAVGGSSISKWLNDSIHRNVPLLSNFKEKVAIGKSYGEVKGLLWHQGESDANLQDIPFYKDRLTELISNFRKTVGKKQLPIFIGELGSFSRGQDNYNKRMKINAEFEKVVLLDTNVYLIKTSDLDHKGDKLHFGSQAQRIMGERFADEYVKKKLK